MHVRRHPQVARLLARLLLKWLAACCMLSDGVRAENQVGALLTIAQLVVRVPTWPSAGGYTYKGTPSEHLDSQVGAHRAQSSHTPNDLWQTDQPTPKQVGTLLLYDTQLPRPPGITDPMAVASYAAG